jgi:ATP-dependent protease ClpP protease subunit
MKRKFSNSSCVLADDHIVWGKTLKYSKKNNNKKASNKKNDSDDEDCCGDVSDSFSSINNNVYSLDNHIYFHSDVNKKSIEMLINKINGLNKQFDKLERNVLVNNIEPNPIYLHITSYGGSVFDCFKGIDVIRRSKIPINTVVDGYVASAGSMLSLVGKKRYMGKMASYLMHQLSAGANGKFSEIEDEYTSLSMLMRKMIDLYVENSNMTKEQVIDQFNHDIWWNVETCLDNGIVDELWDGI